MEPTAAVVTTNGPDLTPQQQQQQQHQQQQMWMQQQQMYQQQWMAAMQQQHMMMYSHPHYYQQQQQMYAQLPHQQQQQQHHQQQQRSGTSDENCTIWIGDLQPWMDEGYLNSCFAQAGEISSVKVIRNKHTGQSERFGFVEFGSHDAADKVLQTFNGIQMPNSDQVFRLNWATVGSGDKRTEPGSELSIFVGDLAPDVTDAVLNETFVSKYPSARGARVVVDPNTGRSKGYGFVRFGDDSERARAITEMDGMYCSTRPMRIGPATPKKQLGQQQNQNQHQYQQQYSSQAVVLAGGHAPNGAMNGQTDGGSSNTTLFVGGLDSDVTDEDLRQSFTQYGEVVSTKIPPGKGCGFVQFSARSSAEDAMEGMNGQIIGKQTVRISWGRNPANKQFRTDYNNQSNGAYYGRQGYGYAAAAAAASNGYGEHQQSVS